ncbi:phospho-N-acetylmuramoyl-pentapeptide-transferase homolog isoform X1 [Silene latifolia]
MTSDYVIFSSDGEDSDGEILVTPINDVDMPTIRKKFVTSEDAVTATAHRLAMFGKRHKKHRITHGLITSLGLIAFLTSFLALVDWCAWRIVRQPLDNFYFLFPFIASAFLVACAGYVSIPLLKLFNIRQKFKRKWLPVHFSKKGPPTVGGLFFIPIGVAVAKFMSGASTEISGMLAVTLAFAAVGLLDDTVRLIKYQNSGLSGVTRIILEVAIAACFSFWLYTTNIPSPYGMKMVVQLPPPFGLVHLGKCYLFLTLFTFILMANGHYLTDGLDGLGGGTSALSFVAMSTAVLPICSGLSIFGASMAGACVGFLLHNRHKASVTMGSTGSFALGGALAAMASCSGMFIPLYIASGFLVLEISAVTIQIVYSKVVQSSQRRGVRSFQIAPLHHHFEMCGMPEHFIVAGAYIVSSLLSLLATYVALISA